VFLAAAAITKNFWGTFNIARAETLELRLSLITLSFMVQDLACTETDEVVLRFCCSVLAGTGVYPGGGLNKRCTGASIYLFLVMG
jgi:hypothetical protein